MRAGWVRFSGSEEGASAVCRRVSEGFLEEVKVGCSALGRTPR